MSRGIITLCGSTQFPEAFQKVNAELTKADYIVLSVGTFERKEYHSDTPEAKKLKERLDMLHKEKISISRAIVVLNVGKYIGLSTWSEINYAEGLKLSIFFLERDKIDDIENYYFSHAGNYRDLL